MDSNHRSRLLVRFPFSLWHVIGFVSETLPTPLITRNQVELMRKDNIREPDAPGFEALQILPQAIENIAGGEGESESISPYPTPTLARAGVRGKSLIFLYPFVLSERPS